MLEKSALLDLFKNKKFALLAKGTATSKFQYLSMAAKTGVITKASRRGDRFGWLKDVLAVLGLSVKLIYRQILLPPVLTVLHLVRIILWFIWVIALEFILRSEVFLKTALVELSIWRRQRNIKLGQRKREIYG